MVKVKLVTDVLKANDALAETNRRLFAERAILVVNLVSSPGSGKTAILERTLLDLTGDLEMAVIEGDIYTSRDAERIEQTGVPVVQINTGGGCHLDASMIQRGLQTLTEEVDIDRLQLLFVENVGNLVCPAGFDLGEDFKVTVLSTTEGDDKPAKYPAMFKKSGAVLVNKIDLLDALGVSLEAIDRELAEVAPQAEIMHVSAKTGEGFGSWTRWLKSEVARKEGGAP